MIESFGLADTLQTAFVLIVAFVLGTLIGAERQYRQRNAGLRTNVLVALGAASFVHLGIELNGHAGAVQVVAYVVSGVGFLGAGVIMREGGEVRGLNTAATLWGSAAVGAACGAHAIGQAVVVTALVLAGNTLLRPLVNAINRAPLDEAATEASYEVRAVVKLADVMAARDLLVATLEAAHYPVRDVSVEKHGTEDAELVAELVANTIDTGEVEAVIARLEASDLVDEASWTSATSD
ncbi:MgtC/SapB family protein [Lichenibacterium ramalinae]|uniref:Protein MgtC n=1 Tax=Lichenibacterium ramalinae TaxID=2316527 RepID=A0A4Q2R5F1_9HYPH|nr:MgtC/SapB family protein [Lichenibacterium ramalinae]RYB01796.1 MgtC/SapB family protein [Lichenibacterium ramalinae]